MSNCNKCKYFLNNNFIFFKVYDNDDKNFKCNNKIINIDKNNINEFDIEELSINFFKDEKIVDNIDFNLKYINYNNNILIASNLLDILINSYNNLSIINLKKKIIIKKIKLLINLNKFDFSKVIVKNLKNNSLLNDLLLNYEKLYKNVNTSHPLIFDIIFEQKINLENNEEYINAVVKGIKNNLDIFKNIFYKGLNIFHILLLEGNHKIYKKIKESISNEDFNNFNTKIKSNIEYEIFFDKNINDIIDFLKISI